MRGSTIFTIIVVFLVATSLASYKKSPASKASKASPSSKAIKASKASTDSPSTSQLDPARFLQFLVQHHSEVSDLPLSYQVPKGYYEKLINETNVISNHTTFEWYCGYAVSATAEARYTLQTEQVLTTYGLAIYDGAVRQIALSLLGRGDLAEKYTNETLTQAKTFQFSSIRAGSNCEGITAFGEANPDYTFCYGGYDANHTHHNVANKNAFIMQIISDYYEPPNTPDARCPQENIPWVWNNWRPITGDNIWANFLGPLQTAYLNSNRNPSAIEDSDLNLQSALNIWPTVELMIHPNGGIGWTPYNTWPDPSGGLVSVENCLSSIASFKAFLQILQSKPHSAYGSFVPRVQTVLSGLLDFVKTAYNPSTGTFRTQGFIYENGTFQWLDPGFALDCQTWAIGALGPNLIDSWFGDNAALNLWKNSKQIAGYKYNHTDGSVRGVGYSTNQHAQAFSGEWTLGAINAVRCLHNYISDPVIRESLANDEESMRNAVQFQLTGKTASGATAVQYANKRYDVPFGWVANPFFALASTSWAVLIDSYYNPFQLGGSYAY